MLLSPACDLHDVRPPCTVKSCNPFTRASLRSVLRLAKWAEWCTQSQLSTTLGVGALALHFWVMVALGRRNPLRAAVPLCLLVHRPCSGGSPSTHTANDLHREMVMIRAWRSMFISPMLCIPGSTSFAPVRGLLHVKAYKCLQGTTCLLPAPSMQLNRPSVQC